MFNHFICIRSLIPNKIIFFLPNPISITVNLNPLNPLSRLIKAVTLKLCLSSLVISRLLHLYSQLNHPPSHKHKHKHNPQKRREKSERKTMEVKRRTAKTLISKLGSVSEQAQAAALCELRLLTKTDPEIRPIIADEGAIPYIADVLYSSEPLAQENAAATLLNLSISCRGALMATRGLLDALSHALSYHTLNHPAAVQSAAATVYSLVVDENYRPIVGSKRDIIYALVDIVRNPKSPNRSIKDALKALFGISLYPLNRSSMVELGAVEVLFGLVAKAETIGLVEDATAVIAQLAGCDESAAAFRLVSGVRLLVDLLDPSTGSSLRIKENAVSGLLNLVQCGGEQIGEEIRQVGLGSVFDGLGEVAQTGSSKGRKRAETLMKTLENGMIVRDSKLTPRNSIDHPGLDSYSGSDLNSGALLDPRCC